MLKISDKISIEEDEIQVRFIRSPGPGGQHVNKVESAVQIRFDAKSSLAINNAMFERLKKLAGGRMTVQGIVILTANSTRSQMRNKQDAINRLLALLKQATFVAKKRKKTRPSMASKKRMSDSKKHKSTIKKLRSNKISD